MTCFKKESSAFSYWILHLLATNFHICLHCQASSPSVLVPRKSHGLCSQSHLSYFSQTSSFTPHYSLIFNFNIFLYISSSIFMHVQSLYLKKMKKNPALLSCLFVSYTLHQPYFVFCRTAHGTMPLVCFTSSFFSR
jgi:hypothetical protein